MPRAKATRGRLKTISCPRCGKKFCTETNVLQHLNQPTGSCYKEPFFDDRRARNHVKSPDDVPPTEPGAQHHDNSSAATEDEFDIEMGFENYPESAPPAAFGDQPEQLGPERFVEMYEGSAECFAGGKTFMDEFMADQYAEQRWENLYFPWASQSEWAFASWLLRSRLSMAAIDSLLALDLVRTI